MNLTKKIFPESIISKNDLDLEDIRLGDIYDNSSKLIEHKSNNKITAIEFIELEKKQSLTKKKEKFINYILCCYEFKTKDPRM